MDRWPGSEKSGSSGTKKGKIVQGSSSAAHEIGYPSLNHGALSAGTIFKRNDTFQWLTVAGRQKCSFSVKSPLTCVFPATRWPGVQDISYSLRQRAEQGARFIRTHHPDIDIPFELIQEELRTDERATAALENFDPYLGDTLSTLYSVESGKRQSALVLFPMGEVDSELNASLITFRKDSLYFQPTTKAIWASDSPIRQIASSFPATSLDNKGGHYAAIRSYGATTILDLSHAFSFSSPKASEIMKIQAEDLFREGVMDVTFRSPEHPDLYAVGNKGSIFQISLNDGRKIIDKISQIHEGGPVWRINASFSQATGYVSSESFVKRFDWRDGIGDILFNQETSDSKFITSLSTSGSNDHILWITTTDEVLWIDTRRALTPLLAWKHHREFDRTLKMKTIDCGTSSIGFLSSRHSILTSAFSVSSGLTDVQPLSFDSRPTALPSVPTVSSNHECTLLKHPWNCNISLFERSANGDLYHQELHYDGNSKETSIEDRTPPNLKINKTNEMKALFNASQSPRVDLGNFAPKDFVEVDFSQLYKKLFEEFVEQKREEDEKVPDAVYDALDRMLAFWQLSDTETEYMRATFDIAFGSGGEPSSEARADFLTGSVFNSIRGWRALRQKKLPIDHLKAKSAWSTDVRGVLERIDSGTFKEDGGEFQYAQEYALQREQLNLEARRRETEDLEQLNLDLALATTVFSGVPFKKAQSDEDEETGALLSRVTQKMSISLSEPGPISFGYLQPIHKDYYNFDKQQSITHKEDKELTVPLGVRLLLSEWDVGANPKNYVFVDPYNLDEESLLPSNELRRNDRGRRNLSSSPEDAIPTVFSQAPPTIVAAKTLTLSQPKPSGSDILHAHHSKAYPSTQVAFSQTAFAQSYPEEPNNSQPALPSTQILPGPFGGRQNLAKKKPTKKRVGGF